MIDGCEAVRDKFQQFYDEGLDTASQLVVYVGNTKIIDLWGNNDATMNYDGDSLHTVFSSGKNVASILLGIMVAEGRVDYNKPVTTYWPEFGQNGKEWVTVEDVM